MVVLDSSRQILVGAVMSAVIGGLPCAANAVESCRAVVSDTDGAIEVSARHVVGDLRWGATSVTQNDRLWNEEGCVRAGRAQSCRLGPIGSPAERTPPAACSIYLRDDVSTCRAHLTGCTPGRRVTAEIPAGRESETVVIRDGKVTRERRTLGRYVVRAPFEPTMPNFDALAAVPSGVLHGYCGDRDGCQVSLAMRWKHGGRAPVSVGPVHWTFPQVSDEPEVANVSGGAADLSATRDVVLSVAGCSLSHETAPGLSPVVLVRRAANPDSLGDCELVIDD